jgi:hypothetical protein
MPTAFGWNRPDGVYFTTPYYDRAICDGGWKTGRVLPNGQLADVASDAGGRVTAFSEDGWILFEEPISQYQNESRLLKFKFAPVVKIKQAKRNVIENGHIVEKRDLIVSWDEPPRMTAASWRAPVRGAISLVQRFPTVPVSTVKSPTNANDRVRQRIEERSSWQFSSRGRLRCYLWRDYRH